MPDIVVRVSADGNNVTGLYSDQIEYGAIGELGIERASDVRYNHATQKWEVYIRMTKEVLPETFTKRSMALAHEVAYLNKRIGDYLEH